MLVQLTSRTCSRTVELRARSTVTRSLMPPSMALTMRALLTASTQSRAGTCTWPTQARMVGSLQ